VGVVLPVATAVAAWLASITSVPRPVAVNTPLVLIDPVPVLDASMV